MGRHAVFRFGLLWLASALLLPVSPAPAGQSPEVSPQRIYPVKPLPPRDSTLAVAVGDPMPDFDLPAVDGSRVRPADYRGQKNLILTFVPAAWTPVCSGQWPGYNIIQDVLEASDTALIGISADNIPTLFAWTREMGGLWFPVASDFWPHGALARRLGILRGDGTTERALFLVDKKGIIRFIDVHDINERPDLGVLLQAVKSVQAGQ